MKSLCLLSLCAVLLGSMGMAMAQNANPPAGGYAACRDDIRKYCAAKQGPDRRKCMRANLRKLTKDCKAAMETGKIDVH